MEKMYKKIENDKVLNIDGENKSQKVYRIERNYLD